MPKKSTGRNKKINRIKNFVLKKNQFFVDTSLFELCLNILKTKIKLAPINIDSPDIYIEDGL